jgi:hypothetical protein
MRESPDEWGSVVAFDAGLRLQTNVRRFRGEVFLYRSLRRLVEVSLSAEERGQPDLFNNECEGMCGV